MTSERLAASQLAAHAALNPHKDPLAGVRLPEWVDREAADLEAKIHATRGRVLELMSRLSEAEKVALLPGAVGKVESLRRRPLSVWRERPDGTCGADLRHRLAAVAFTESAAGRSLTNDELRSYASDYGLLCNELAYAEAMLSECGDAAIRFAETLKSPVDLSPLDQYLRRYARSAADALQVAEVLKGRAAAIRYGAGERPPTSQLTAPLGATAVNKRPSAGKTDEPRGVGPGRPGRSSRMDRSTDCRRGGVRPIKPVPDGEIQARP